MNHDRFLFPHTKIDWKITDLTQKVSRGGGNVVMLIRLMKLHLSKAMFHDGNEGVQKFGDLLVALTVFLALLKYSYGIDAVQISKVSLLATAAE